MKPSRPASDYLDAIIDDANVTTILVFCGADQKPAAFMRAVGAPGKQDKRLSFSRERPVAVWEKRL